MFKINGLDSSSCYFSFQYVSYGTTSKEKVQTNTNDSTIKTYIDNWYKKNLLDTNNEKYLVDNIFCNGRSIGNLSDNDKNYGFNNKSYGRNLTYYRWYYGPWSSGGYNSSMKLVCSQQNDAFTVNDVVKGNGALTYAIGLLSTDEAVLAG